MLEVRHHMESMAMASTTASSLMASETMDMDMDMDMDSMHMYFTTNYKEYPVLFRTLLAANAGQAFGIFLLLFVVAFLVRGIEFARNYLEQRVWKNPSFVECHPGAVTPVKSSCCDKDDSSHELEAAVPPNHLSLATRLVRDAIRLVLCILPDLFGFALMLAAMTYTLTYFFAVVLGLGIGRFFFERLSDRHNLRAIGPTGFHCN